MIRISERKGTNNFHPIDDDRKLNYKEYSLNR